MPVVTRYVENSALGNRLFVFVTSRSAFHRLWIVAFDSGAAGDP